MPVCPRAAFLSLICRHQTYTQYLPILTTPMTCDPPEQPSIEWKHLRTFLPAPATAVLCPPHSAGGPEVHSVEEKPKSCEDVVRKEGRAGERVCRCARGTRGCVPGLVTVPRLNHFKKEGPRFSRLLTRVAEAVHPVTLRCAWRPLPASTLALGSSEGCVLSVTASLSYFYSKGNACMCVCVHCDTPPDAACGAGSRTFGHSLTPARV